MTAYAIARLDEIAEQDDGRCPWRPVRHHFGITSFGINAWTGRSKGDRIINEHDESDPQDLSEELYIVTAGRAVFELDGERRDAPAGTYVFVEPAVKRTAFAEESGTTIVSIGGVPGQAYEPSGWEVWETVRQLYEQGDYEGVIERGRELIEANPQYAVPLYNLACCESLAGHKEDALAHLRQAVEKSDRLRASAKADSDLDAIRNEPAFQEIVAV